MWLNGALVETACAESENYAGMRKVVDELGISELPNTNYLRAAKRVVGARPAQCRMKVPRGEHAGGGLADA